MAPREPRASGVLSETGYKHRRDTFKGKTADVQQSFLEELGKKGEDPVSFFGGWSVEKVISKAKEPLALGMLSQTTYRNRRGKFKAKTADDRQSFLEELKKKGEDAKSYFGGWTVERAMSEAKIKQPRAPGVLSQGKYRWRRQKFKGKTADNRQSFLKELMKNGEDPESYFGGWSVKRILA